MCWKPEQISTRPTGLDHRDTPAAAVHAQTPSLAEPDSSPGFRLGRRWACVAQPTGAVPSYYAGEGSAPTPRVEMGLFDTITESIFGPARSKPPGDHCPSRRSLAKVGTKPGCHRPTVREAPRQGWINAMDGNLYRLWFFTFGSGVQQRSEGQNAYPIGSPNTLLTPLSRRPGADALNRIPFVIRNRTPPPACPSWTREQSEGDGDDDEPQRVWRYVVHAPLLAARDEGLLAHGRNGRLVTPTGTQPLAGRIMTCRCSATSPSTSQRWSTPPSPTVIRPA